MLLQHLVKKSFTPQHWTSGTMSFRDGRVSQVRYHKPWVSGIVSTKAGGAAQHTTTFKLHRDGIQSPKCNTCGDIWCEHLAALVIWWMARGSLLRAGIVDERMGASATITTLSQDAKTRAATANAKSPVRAEPVAYVHLVSRDDGTFGVTVEPALRYQDPVKGTTRIEVVRVLTRLEGTLAWKNVQGYRLEAELENIPVLGSVSAVRTTYLGQSAVQFLGRLLSGTDSDRVVLDPALRVKLEPKALKLASFEVGKKLNNKRSIKFTFSNGKHTLSSEEITELSEEGRVSSDFVWKGDILYKLETSLATIAKHINRSGVNTLEKISAKPLEALAQLEDEAEHPLHPIAIFRLSLELGAIDFIVDESWAEFHEWKANFERKRIPALPRVSYGFDLREYQANGLSWIWSLYNRGLSAFLADDMGLGKTHQVLAFLSCLYRSPKHRPNAPSIVVAPTSVVAAWKQKLERYETGLSWYIYHGTGRELPPHSVDMIITTYGVLQRDKVLRDRDWHIAIADESQAIKNANTSTSRISRALKARFRIAMTGTPVENSATDLWSALEFLLPGYLGSQARFKRLYSSKGEALPAEKSALIKKLITPFLLRRTKSQVLTELPEKTEETLACELTIEQRRVYNEYLKGEDARKIRKDLEDGTKVDYTGILALLTKLKQVCDHPELPDLTSKSSMVSAATVNPLTAGKWETLQEIVHEALGSNLKVVVFTQFLGMLDLMKAWLKSEGVQYAELRGDTRDRSGELNRFANDPECKVFLCSLMAGGLGIDLTSASVCIHYDRWWNPARENQATDRLHRIGQTRGVQVFKLQSPNTVEDRIARIIESKIALSGSLIEDSSLGLKSFSRDELLSLLNELVGV